jgi:hypothetical protein
MNKIILIVILIFAPIIVWATPPGTILISTAVVNYKDLKGTDMVPTTSPQCFCVVSSPLTEKIPQHVFMGQIYKR